MELASTVSRIIFIYIYGSKAGEEKGNGTVSPCFDLLSIETVDHFQNPPSF